MVLFYHSLSTHSLIVYAKADLPPLSLFLIPWFTTPVVLPRFYASVRNTVTTCIRISILAHMYFSSYSSSSSPFSGFVDDPKILSRSLLYLKSNSNLAFHIQSFVFNNFLIVIFCMLSCDDDMDCAIIAEGCPNKCLANTNFTFVIF